VGVTARGDTGRGASVSLHPFDRRDLSTELEEICAHVDGIKGERAAEAGQLSQLVVEISNALVGLGMLPI
jgi:hypothetical protein